MSRTSLWVSSGLCWDKGEREELDTDFFLRIVNQICFILFTPGFGKNDTPPPHF